MAGKPAARIGDPTCHGGTLVGPGVPTVFIGGMPASTMGDNHLCPMCTPATPPIPHVGGPVVLGSTGVFIGKKPAARLGDQSVCVGPPSAIVMGCPTVLIGEAGSGSGSGAGAASPAEVSALADAAAPLAALSSDRTSETGHRIELRFEDSSGRPLAGVPFLLEDPQGQKILAASDAEGGWLRTGLSQAGSYTVDVRLLRKARCDTSKVELDKSCHFFCEASGFPEGEPAVVKMQLLAADGTAQTVDTVRTQVKGERIEVSWSLTRQAYAQAVHSTEDFLPESLDAVFTAGVQSLLGTPVPLEVPKDAASLEIPTAALGTVHFRTDGCVPLLDDKLELIRILSDVLDYADEARERGETAILFGSASSNGSAAHNRELSLWRGLMVKSLLEHDEIAWRNQARAHATPEDAQQIFTSLHASGWECDPASDSKGVLEFQKEANVRLEFDVTEDGVMGPRTWTAIHRALCSLIQVERRDDFEDSEWAPPTWGYAAGAGVYPNGSDFASGGNKEDVEICFFPKGCEPKLKLPKGGKPATKKENSAEDKKKVQKKPLDLKPISSGSDLKIDMRFPLDPAMRKQILNGPSSYHTGGRQFGRPRENGKRAHAGCDLIAPVGTPIYAVADGVISDYSSFYNQTYAIEVDHGTFTVRYGEVQPPTDAGVKNHWGVDSPPPEQCKGLGPNLKLKMKIRRGQLIGWVGQLRTKTKKGMKDGNHMLHFEIYANTKEGPLTVKNSQKYDYVPMKTYQRRSDLLNPTTHLDNASNE